jgi:hypothetical protein
MTPLYLFMGRGIFQSGPTNQIYAVPESML